MGRNSNRKYRRTLASIIVLSLAMVLALSSCASDPELLDGEAPYENIPEIEKFVSGHSRSAVGNKFGKVTISLNIKDEFVDRVECTDAFYLEYTTSEDDIGYFPVVVQNDSDKLCNEKYTFKPFEKKKINVDIDSYYDFCPNGHYRLVKIFDVKYYNGKTEQRKAYFML